jgi:predicted esterase
MQTNWLRVIVPIAALCLAACDSSSDNDRDDENAGPPPRGSLIEDPPARVTSLSAADIVVALGGTLEGQQFLQFAGSPACRVDVHQLRYNTVAANDEPTTASGALLIPAGIEPECQGDRPVLLYAHGTTTDRNFNMVEVTNTDNLEAGLMAAAFAARGYIVVAPNYVGYDTSNSSTHPYLNADQSAKDMTDALTAARSAIPTTLAPTTRASSQLFVTGYSQGGHVAMATHRALQAAGVAVTASAPMSGPYALSAFGDAVFYGQVNAGAPVFLTMLITGYDRAYGDIYAAPTEAFEARYANGIETLLPSTTSRSELFGTGRLPRDQLFSEVPPDPAYAPYTPATAPEDFAAIFANGFGPDHLLTNSLRLSYLQDAQANPDGAFPTTTTVQPPANPAHPLRRAFKANDLRNWTPTAPMLLCGGSGDPTVFYFNTQFMQAYWATTSAPVTVLDVDSEPTDNDTYEDLKQGFDIAKALVAAGAIADGADDGGEAAVNEAYHAGLVSAFCLTAVGKYFDSYVTP